MMAEAGRSSSLFNGAATWVDGAKKNYQAQVDPVQELDNFSLSPSHDHTPDSTTASHTAAMSCSCNASPLRLFARGLVQVHRLEPGASLALPIRGLRHTGAQQQYLHASRQLQDAASERPVTPQPTTRRPDASSASNRFSAGRQTTRPSRPGPSERGSRFTNNSDTRGERARKFKQQGFDWKSFRSSDPAKRAKADTSNFDWKNWKGNKFADKSAGLKGLLTNLKNAQEQDREAVGVHRGGDRTSRGNSNRSTGYSSREDGWRAHDEFPPKKKEDWMIQKEALKAQFPEGWKPRKRLSPDALAGIRALNAQFPDVYTTQTLSEKFEVSPEAIRRILKSRWQPSVAEEEDRSERWHRRGQSIWKNKAAHGIKPPKRWRDEGINVDEEHHERKAEAHRTTETFLQKSREEYMQGFERAKASRRVSSVDDDFGIKSTKSEPKTDGQTTAKTVAAQDAVEWPKKNE